MPSTKTMEDLEAAAAALNQASDDLNEVIEGLEDRFERLGIGVSCWLDVLPNSWALGYAKHDGRWRIVVKAPEAQAVPLLKAPRSLRVDAALQLGALAECLTAKMGDHISAINEAKRLIGKLAPTK